MNAKDIKPNITENYNLYKNAIAEINNGILKPTFDIASNVKNLDKKTDKKTDDSFLKLYGSLDTDETAEELIEKTRAARNFNRKIESKARNTNR